MITGYINKMPFFNSYQLRTKYIDLCKRKPMEITDKIYSWNLAWFKTESHIRTQTFFKINR